MELAITGMGCVSPLGTSAAQLWDGLVAGAVAIRPARWADTAGDGLYAPIADDFDPTLWMDQRVVDGTDGFARFALAACAQALADAGLDPGGLDPRRTGVVHGTSMGGHFTVARAQRDFDRGGIAAIDRKTQIKMWPNMAAAQICMAYGLHGPSLTVTTACAASLDALGTAAMYIESGRCDLVVVGATEGGYTADDGAEEFMAGFVAAEQAYGMNIGQLDPKRALLPFDVERIGVIAGEGSAFFVLESAAHAARRGARVHAWLRGYASLADAYHPSSPEPSGRWEQLVMTEAQRSAEVPAGEIDALVAHATGTPKGDQAEIRAINEVFSDSSTLVVTAIKGHTGHTGAASGAMSIIGGVNAMHDGRLMHVAGTTQLDPEIRFDVALHEPRRHDIELLQINSFGFGGQNSSVVLSRSGADSGH